MDVRLAGPPDDLPLPRAVPQKGAIYRGLVIGVSDSEGPVHPLSARWPDEHGRFELVLPRSVRGKRVRFWQYDLETFSRTTARPGGLIDQAAWPATLQPHVARDVATLPIPG